MFTDNLIRIKRILLKNHCVNRDAKITFAEKRKVNLNAWVDMKRDIQNVGDWLSVVVVSELAKRHQIDLDKKVSKTKHLYAIGSQLLGFQDATIFGGGFAKDHTQSKFFRLYALFHKCYHKTDVRAVRGPLSKRILDEMGIECPEIYGDPAILMPLFYQPKVGKKRKYVIVPHYNEWQKFHKDENYLSTFTSDYKAFIDFLCSGEVVISSSLHGIILAEAYGVPAIMIENESCYGNIFKYKDYYLSTGREKFTIAKSLEEALKLPYNKPDKELISQMQNKLLEAFPVDLWEE